MGSNDIHPRPGAFHGWPNNIYTNFKCSYRYTLSILLVAIEGFRADLAENFQSRDKRIMELCQNAY